MWTHSDVAVLLTAAQTANLLQQSLIDFIWLDGAGVVSEERGHGTQDFVRRDSHHALSDGTAPDKN